MIWGENPLFSETATCADKLWFCDWKNVCFMSRIQSNTPRFSEDQISHATSDPGVFPWVEFPYGKHPQEPRNPKAMDMYGILQPQHHASRFMEDVLKNTTLQRFWKIGLYKKQSCNHLWGVFFQGGDPGNVGVPSYLLAPPFFRTSFSWNQTDAWNW